MVVKLCTICGVAFDARGTTKACSDECKAVNMCKKSARWRDANPDRERERMALWRDANRDKAREQYLRWYSANRDRERERLARWRDANRDKFLAIQRLSKNKRRLAAIRIELNRLKEEPHASV